MIKTEEKKKKYETCSQSDRTQATNPNTSDDHWNLSATGMSYRQQLFVGVAGGHTQKSRYCGVPGMKREPHEQVAGNKHQRSLTYQSDNTN